MTIENVDLTIIKAMPFIIYGILGVFVVGLAKLISVLSVKTKTKEILTALIISIFTTIIIIIYHSMKRESVVTIQHGVSYEVLEHKMEKKGSDYIIIDLTNNKTYDADEIDYELYLKCSSKKISWYISSEEFHLFELKLYSSKIESTSLYCPDYE